MRHRVMFKSAWACVMTLIVPEALDNAPDDAERVSRLSGEQDCFVGLPRDPSDAHGIGLRAEAALVVQVE